MPKKQAFSCSAIDFCVQSIGNKIMLLESKWSLAREKEGCFVIRGFICRYLSAEGNDNKHCFIEMFTSNFQFTWEETRSYWLSTENHQQVLWSQGYIWNTFPFNWKDLNTNTNTHTPVSYTHLTLPTICSV